MRQLSGNVKRKEGGAIAAQLLGLVGPLLPPAARDKLALLELDELITRLVMWAKLDRVPPELVGEVHSLPPIVRDEILGILGIMDAGVAPLRVNLRKGREYAVISWHEGYRAQTAGIYMHFNWVVLVALQAQTDAFEARRTLSRDEKDKEDEDL